MLAMTMITGGDDYHDSVFDDAEGGARADVYSVILACSASRCCTSPTSSAV